MGGIVRCFLGTMLGYLRIFAESCLLFERFVNSPFPTATKDPGTEPGSSAVCVLL